MANLYGVANPIGTPSYGNLIGGANVSCPAGVETNILACPLSPPLSGGYYYLGCWLALNLLIGATPPTNLTVGFRIGAGADFATSAFPLAIYVANATLYLPTMVYGTGTILGPPFSPITVNMSINPVAQAVTALYFFTYGYAWYNRAPDQ